MESTQGAILIDVSAESDVEADRRFFERLGHPVMVCHGPPHGRLCPILSGAGCPMVDESHGIIFELDLDRPQHRAILKRYREVVAEDILIWAVVRPGQEVTYADALTGVHVLTGPPTTGELDGIAAEIEAYDRIAS